VSICILKYSAVCLYLSSLCVYVYCMYVYVGRGLSQPH